MQHNTGAYAPGDPWTKLRHSRIGEGVHNTRERITHMPKVRAVALIGGVGFIIAISFLIVAIVKSNKSTEDGIHGVIHPDDSPAPPKGCKKNGCKQNYVCDKGSNECIQKKCKHNGDCGSDTVCRFDLGVCTHVECNGVMDCDDPENSICDNQLCKAKPDDLEKQLFLQIVGFIGEGFKDENGNNVLARKAHRVRQKRVREFVLVCIALTLILGIFLVTSFTKSVVRLYKVVASNMVILMALLAVFVSLAGVLLSRASNIMKFKKKMAQKLREMRDNEPEKHAGELGMTTAEYKREIGKYLEQLERRGNVFVMEGECSSQPIKCKSYPDEDLAVINTMSEIDQKWGVMAGAFSALMAFIVFYHIVLNLISESPDDRERFERDVDSVF